MILPYDVVREIFFQRTIINLGIRFYLPQKKSFIYLFDVNNQCIFIICLKTDWQSKTNNLLLASIDEETALSCQHLTIMNFVEEKHLVSGIPKGMFTQKHLF